MALFVVKTFVEESFLETSADYAAYKRAVRWRFVPGLV